MEYPPGAACKGKIFLSCIKEKHYSREVILEEHALVHIFSGVLTIYHANHTLVFRAGDTVLIPRNQVGRLAKLPEEGSPFKSVSLLFPEELLRSYYATHPVTEWDQKSASHRPLARHPLLESLFNSLLPYFDMHEELPADIAGLKIQETLTILRACDQQASRLLGSFHEPGKINLADYMEQHYMFNLPLEKFGYLTGRSLTTFKKDFKRIYKTPPGRWLTRKRLELAHFQIVVNGRKPSEVYIDAGFENLSHFSFAFKKQFGYNPTDKRPGQGTNSELETMVALAGIL
ncbi:helix-turn-helix domain-containing protein [Spirosoma koreense]